MPSPLAHGAAGYLVHRLRAAQSGEGAAPGRSGWWALLATIGLSLLPDLDAIPGILSGDFAAYHNNSTHSLAMALPAALAVGGLVWLRGRAGFTFWFTTALVCYQLHVIMDYFTLGRGVMLLWPFSGERYSSPILLFAGVAWSDGLVSSRHLWTLLGELVFVGAIALATRLIGGRAGSYRTRLGRRQAGTLP